MYRTNLAGSDLRDADFKKADLRLAKLESTNLIEANFTTTDLRDVNLNGADIINTKFSECDSKSGIHNQVQNLSILKIDAQKRGGIFEDSCMK